MWANLSTAGAGNDIFVDESLSGQITIRWNATHVPDGGEVNFSVTLFTNGKIRFDYGAGNIGLSPTVGISNGSGHYLLADHDGEGNLNHAVSRRFFLAPGIVDIGAYEFQGDSLDITPPTVISSDLVVTEQDGQALKYIYLTFSEPINPIDARSPDNYEFRYAGPDGIFGNQDDVIYPLFPQYSAGQTTVILVIGDPSSLPGSTELPVGEYRLTVLGTATSSIHDLAGNRFDGNQDGVPGGNYVRFFDVIESTVAEVVGSYIYHRGSTFDVGNLTDALDTIKTLAKEDSEPITLGFNNLINTSRGINGLVFDILHLAGVPTAADFVFQWSPQGAFSELSNAPADWQFALEPAAITVLPGSPDRVIIGWPDGEIVNRWLRITILPTSNTGLSLPQVYYIGHLLGETTGPIDSLYTVSFADISPIRGAVGQTADAGSIFDIDKSGTVAFADISAMRGNIGAQLTNITIQASTGNGEMLGAIGSIGDEDDLKGKFDSEDDLADLARGWFIGSLNTEHGTDRLSVYAQRPVAEGHGLERRPEPLALWPQNRSLELGLESRSKIGMSTVRDYRNMTDRLFGHEQTKNATGQRDSLSLITDSQLSVSLIDDFFHDFR